jgi:hypothetical protein
MKNLFIKINLTLALTVALFCYAAAQAPPAIEIPLAKVGESLTYEGKVSKILPSMAVADLTFSLDRVPDSDNLVIKTEAVSKGTLLKLFRYSFLQQYESITDPVTLRVLKTTKHDVQKDRVRDSESVFDYSEKRVTFTETNPLDPNRAPRKIASEIGDNVNDIVTGIYALRTMPLAFGKRFTLTVSDSGLVYEVPVRVTARERQKSILGKTMCFRIEPVIFGTGRLIERKGSMIIWITDDERRMPVRARIKTDFGKVEIKLRSMVGGS